MRLMIRLKPVETKKKRVCSACYTKGEVTESCHKCHGMGVINSSTIRYRVAAHPVEIVKVDRDPRNGIIRYWENQSEFTYETTIPELNKYVPEVPFGIHLLHDSYEEAFAEAARVNEALDKREAEAAKCSTNVNKPFSTRKAENKNIDKSLYSKAMLWDLDDFLNIQ